MDLPVIENGDPAGGTTPPKRKPLAVGKLKAVAKAPVTMPDSIITPKGNVLTKQQFLDSAKQGLPFTDMKTMGDWLDEWVVNKKSTPPPPPTQAPQIKQDYYQGYSTPGSGGMRYHQ
jgi:hypothetical protein